jgi:hypothetical protein
MFNIIQVPLTLTIIIKRWYDIKKKIIFKNKQSISYYQLRKCFLILPIVYGSSQIRRTGQERYVCVSAS